MSKKEVIKILKMEWLFGRRMTPDEMLRKNQRALNKAMRELDRERSKMEQQEKKIIADIKKMAKQGQMDAVKIMAKVSYYLFRSNRKYNLMFLGFGTNSTIHQEVYAYASQHSSSFPENSNPQIAKCHGSSHERRDQSHGQHEQTDEVA